MKQAQPIDDKFLTRFASEHWERKPLLQRNIDSDLLQLDDAEVFTLVVSAADRSRRERKLLGFKFYTHGIRSSDVETFYVLPRKSDKTFHGYNERMERMYQDYCLVCDELLQVNHRKQALLTEFTQKLYRHVGFPNRFAEMGLYLGNYRITPFGVHRDPCGVFSFPVVGIKTFRTWSSAYVAKNPELEQSFKYNKHKKHSQILTASSRDMIYWPSTSWHIAESDGSFSATWSLGVWIDRPTSELVTETLIDLLLKSLDPKLAIELRSGVVKENLMDSKTNSKGQIQKLPEVFHKSISALKSLTHTQLETSFRKAWVSRLAKSSLKTQAIPDDTFRLGKCIRLRDRKIFWTLDEDATLAQPKFHFSIADSGIYFSHSKSLLSLIKDLNAGKTCLLAGYFNEKNRKQTLPVLKMLGAAGAFLNI